MELAQQGINVANIDALIKENHTQFLKDFGFIGDKVSADHHWQLVRTMSKVQIILEHLRIHDVIDQPSVVNESDSYRKMVLSKKGNVENEIELATDGHTIFVRVKSFEVMYGNSPFALNQTQKSWKNVSEAEFNWEMFASGLLSFIHQCMYQESVSYKIKVFGAFLAES